MYRPNIYLFHGTKYDFKFGYFLSNIDQMFLGYLIDYKILTLLLLLVFYEFFGIVFIVMPLVYFVNIYFVNKLKGKNWKNKTRAKGTF